MPSATETTRKHSRRTAYTSFCTQPVLLLSSFNYLPRTDLREPQKHSDLPRIRVRETIKHTSSPTRYQTTSSVSLRVCPSAANRMRRAIPEPTKSKVGHRKRSVSSTCHQRCQAGFFATRSPKTALWPMSAPMAPPTSCFTQSPSRTNTLTSSTSKLPSSAPYSRSTPGPVMPPRRPGSVALTSPTSRARTLLATTLSRS